MKSKFSIVIGLFLLVSCSSESKLDIPKPDSEAVIEIKRFDLELLDADIYNLKELNSNWISEYGLLYESFISQMINAGHPKDPMINYRLEKFLTDTTIIEIKRGLKEVFPDFSKYQKELNNSFGYYSHYYPKAKQPVIIPFYSNFNAKAFPYKDTLGIGMDMYLGRDHQIVSYLAPDMFPQYFKKDMDPEYLVTESIKSWIYANHSLPGEYVNNTLYSTRDDFLSTLIYHGKMMLLLEAITPFSDDKTRFAYTQQEIEWCQKNEKYLYQNLVEFELLFSKNIKELKAYVNPGSFTPGLPEVAPGEIGKWIGYRMVKNYFESTDISLQTLVENQNDSRKILQKYRP